MLVLSSCVNTLDTKPSVIITDNIVWADRTSVDNFINDTYAYVLNYTGVANGGSTMWSARTPNGIKAIVVPNALDRVVTEDFDANIDFGINLFEPLRKCNMIIEKVSASQSLPQVDKEELLAQGHFLRAIIFFYQAKTMGRFVPMTHLLDAQSFEQSRIALTKDVAESYDYVIQDLLYASEHLPLQSPSGIANRWSAKLILSRAALQAYAYTSDAKYLDLVEKNAKDVIENSGRGITEDYASIFNENSDNANEILFARYYLSEDTKLGDVSEISETMPRILAQFMQAAESPEQYSDGEQIFDGRAVYFPTQDMVDQYLVKDLKTGEALAWDKTSQYLENVEKLDVALLSEPGVMDSYTRADNATRAFPTSDDMNNRKPGYPAFTTYVQLKPSATKNISQLMYEQRDARFYASIIYDGAVWIKGFKIGLNLNGNLAMGVSPMEGGGYYNTTTSYYWKKNTLENISSVNTNLPVSTHVVIARLSEAYLNMAELMLLKNNVSEAVKYLNVTRTIHGKLPESKANTLEEAWKDYIRERRVEMCNEQGDIYFSYLRWGKYGGFANHGAEAGDVVQDLDAPAHKIEISRDRRRMLISQHTLLTTANRKFTKKRYLLPISRAFLANREAQGLDHEQNPGW